MTDWFVIGGIIAGVVVIASLLSLLFDAAWWTRVAFVALITIGALLLVGVAWTLAEALSILLRWFHTLSLSLS